jgi:GAF domain-containing protein
VDTQAREGDVSGGDQGGIVGAHGRPSHVGDPLPDDAPLAAVLGAFAHLGVLLEREPDVTRYLDLAADVAGELLTCTALAVVLVRDRRPEYAAFSPNDATYVPWVLRESDDGPWFEAIDHGSAVVCRIDDLPPHLTSFRRRATSIGVMSCAAFPLRVAGDDQAIEIPGALVALRLDSAPWGRSDLSLGTSLAAVITAQLHQHHAVLAATRRAQQLQVALDGRVVLEQAKGMAAATLDVTVGVAFELLRAWARRHRRSVHDVAGDVVARRLDVRALADAAN